MTAQWLAIVLPGEASSGEKGLTELGRAQARSLAQALWDNIAIAPAVAILSSPTGDAKETAKIISGRFPFVADLEYDWDLFRPQFVSPAELRRTAAMISLRLDRYAALVIVTHEPHLITLPGFFAQSKWGVVPFEYRPSPSKGTGVLLNLGEKSGSWIP